MGNSRLVTRIPKNANRPVCNVRLPIQHGCAGPGCGWFCQADRKKSMPHPPMTLRYAFSINETQSSPVVSVWEQRSLPRCVACMGRNKLKRRVSNTRKNKVSNKTKEVRKQRREQEKDKKTKTERKKKGKRKRRKKKQPTLNLPPRRRIRL